MVDSSCAQFTTKISFQIPQLFENNAQKYFTEIYITSYYSKGVKQISTNEWRKQKKKTDCHPDVL